MRMPLQAVATEMLLVAPGFAPRTGRHDYVTSIVQKVSSTGGCSVQEAIYSVNLHTNPAIDSVNADGSGDFITTRCVPGAGGQISFDNVRFSRVSDAIPLGG